MADTERVTQPSSGSNELGVETNDTHIPTGSRSGTDTQLHLAARSGHKNKNKQKDDINDDEKVVKNKPNDDFLQSNETDE